MIAAPIAAWLVKHLAARVLGVAAGGLIILTNSKTHRSRPLGVPGVGVAVVAAVVFVLWITGIVWAVKQERLSQAAARRRGGAGVGHGLTPAAYVVSAPLEVGVRACGRAERVDQVDCLGRHI